MYVIQQIEVIELIVLLEVTFVVQLLLIMLHIAFIGLHLIEHSVSYAKTSKIKNLVLSQVFCIEVFLN